RAPAARRRTTPSRPGAPRSARARSRLPRFLGLDPRILVAPRMCLLAQLGHEPRQLGAAWAPAGTDPARERLHLLDMDVRVERHGRESGRRVARDGAAAAPVVGRADLVHRPAVFHPQRPGAIGDEAARLDGRARGVDRRPAAVLEAYVAG